MKYILFILFFISLVSFAQVNTGDVIKANEFNNSMFNIGDVKHSMLTVSEFQSLHGDCWVKMQGQDVSTSDYGQMKRNSAGNQSLTVLLPNATNQFLRDRGDSGLGTIQADATAKNGLSLSNYSHNHIQGQGAPDNAAYNLFGKTGTVTDRPGGSSANGVRVLTDTDTHNHTIYGDSETRPTNLGINYFLKVNKMCN